MVSCERCGSESPDGFRFCGACGAPLPGSEVLRGSRKLVTSLFCDIAGSTELGERLDPEVLRNVINRYFEAISATIERHGGTVQKFAGDAVMAVFGIPRVHEDDALRAVRAAAEIHSALPSIAERVGVELRFRTGINTGLVLSDEGRSLALGDAVNVAARLEQAALPGEIIIGAETLRHVRDAVEVQPLAPVSARGKSEPVEAFRLLSIDPVAPGRARRFDIALVGRARELRLLRENFERTHAQKSCHLFTVLGTAGVGKTRLVAELLSEVTGEGTVLSGRCLPYGEGITFWPLIEALAVVGEAAARVRERLTAGGVATPEELFLEVRLLVESLAHVRPVILNVEDLQWAEPMLLDLLDHVTEISRGAPILVLCTARPELLEDRPTWGAGKLNSTSVLLEPLERGDCERLLEDLDRSLAPSVRERLIGTAEGNPLFLQEMAAFAQELGTSALPPTISALLAARIERLSDLERGPLERGAVEGEVFHRAAVSALGDEESPETISSRLDELVRKDLIRPHPRTLLDDDAFRFRHLLIRDATYERLPMATRAELHERFADWLEVAAAGMTELDEIAGWHLEQAVGYERELGAELDPGVLRRAAEHLHAAARRAGERGDVAAAANLLERALALCSAGSPLHETITLELAERLIETGDLARADVLLSDAERGSHLTPVVELGRLEWQVLVDPGRAREAIISRLPELRERLERDRDERGLARAHMLGFWCRWSSNNATVAAAEARAAAEHAGRAGDNGLRARAVGWYVATLMYGAARPEEVAAELDAISDEEHGPYLGACLELGRAELERLRGSFGPAAHLTELAREAFAGLGMPIMAAGCEQVRGRIELSRGDPRAALASLRSCDRVLAQLGERSQRSTAQALIARAALLAGDGRAAAAAVKLAEELAAPEEVTVYAITHEVRAELSLAQGEDEDAERWARSAVALASATDFAGFRADARLGLARVLEARERRAEAVVEARAALESYAEKGDDPGGAAARSLLEAIG